MAGTLERLGKYQIRSVLGQGAMGIVYEGMDPDIERMVAIKVLHPHLRNTPEGESLKQRFRREARAAARCIHPNIVTIFELGHDNDQDFIVIEYIQGEELKFFLDSKHEFATEEALHIIKEVLSGLGAAHQHGVIHRDIKPANIMLLDNGGVKVADFGVARLDQSDLTMAGNMVGTPVYMSPEGLRGDEVDQRADLYSSGMVLLEILTGKKPTPQQLYGQPIDQFIEDVFQSEAGSHLSEALRGILRRALASDREKRYQSAHDLLKDLQSITQTEEKRSHTVESLSQTVISQRPILRQAAPASLELEEDVLKLLESGLTSYIGPLAGVLIKRSLNGSNDLDQLLSSLGEHIQNEKERVEFLNSTKKILGLHRSTVSTVNTMAGTAVVADQLTPDQVEELAQALAYYVGPLARQLVERHARKLGSYEQLCETLAESIPSQKERQDFLKRAIK